MRILKHGIKVVLTWSTSSTRIKILVEPIMQNCSKTFIRSNCFLWFANLNQLSSLIDCEITLHSISIHLIKKSSGFTNLLTLINDEHLKYHIEAWQRWHALSTKYKWISIYMWFRFHRTIYNDGDDNSKYIHYTPRGLHTNIGGCNVVHDSDDNPLAPLNPPERMLWFLWH